MSRTWTQFLSDRGDTHIDLRIEGVGAWLSTGELAAANGDARYRFCPGQPIYAAGEPVTVWAPFLNHPLPSLRGEQIAGVFGGVPDLGGMNFRILDVDDALTALFATDVDPVTVLDEDIDADDLTFDIRAIGGIASTDTTLWIGEEAMRVTNRTSLTVTVERAYLGTEATPHLEGDPVYTSNPLILGRVVELRLAPADGTSAAEEQTTFVGFIDGCAWDDDLNVWAMKATSSLRELDIDLPYEVREFEIAGFDPEENYIALETDTVADVFEWIHWTGVNATEEFPPIDFYALTEAGEILGCLVSVSVSRPGAFISHRAMFGSKQGDITGFLRQVFVSGPEPGNWPSSFRYSPGPTPGDDMLLDDFTPSSHWVDLMLAIMTSPSDDFCGVRQGLNYTSAGNWSTLPPGYGLGIPAARIDFASFLEVKARTVQYMFPNLVLGADDVTSGGAFLTKYFLEPMGAYLSMDSGQIRLFIPRIPIRGEDLPLIDADAFLAKETRPNTYTPRVTAALSTSEQVSAVEYIVGPEKKPLSFKTKDFDATNGRRGRYRGRTKPAKATIAAGDEGLADLYGSRAQARFLLQKRPRVTVTGDVDIDPIWNCPTGSLAYVTLDEIPNLSQRVRGWGEVSAQVRKREFVLDVGDGGDGLYAKTELWAYGDNLRSARIGSAAIITSIAGSPTVVVEANRYTSPNAPTGFPDQDCLAFSVADVVRLINLDGTAADAGTETIVAITPGTNSIQLSGDFTGSLANGLILVPADYDDSVVRQQERFAYAADTDDQTIDASTDPPMVFGEDAVTTQSAPEMSSVYGSIDSDAFHDGMAIDGHTERVLNLNANRLKGKAQHILSLVWPIQSTALAFDGHQRWAPTTSWARLLPKMPIAYRRGLSRAELRISARISSSHTIWMQVATKAQPFARGATPSGTNTIDLTGDGDDDIDVYTKTGLWLDPSGYDELDIRILGFETTDLADTVVGGTPAVRSGLGTLSYTQTWVGYAGAGTWTEEGFANLGTEIAFDVGGGTYDLRRLVTGCSSDGNVLNWAPAIDPVLDDNTILNLVSAADDWELYRLPTIGLICFSLMGEERTD